MIIDDESKATERRGGTDRPTRLGLATNATKALASWLAPLPSTCLALIQSPGSGDIKRPVMAVAGWPIALSSDTNFPAELAREGDFLPVTGVGTNVLLLTSEL